MFWLPTFLSMGVTAMKMGISVYTYTKLRSWGLPMAFYECLYFMAAGSHRCHNRQQSLDCIEYFSGVSHICTAFAATGLNSVGYDIAFDPTYHDLCRSEGYVYALTLMLCLSAEGLAWFATVCSSWVWLCQHKSCRTFQNALGRNDIVSIMDGNRQVARSATLMALCAAKHAWWALEQPLKSLMA